MRFCSFCSFCALLLVLLVGYAKIESSPFCLGSLPSTFYEDACYAIITEAKNFTEARKACQTNFHPASDLIKISNAETNAFIQSIYPSMAWISLYDFMEGGGGPSALWRWIDASSPSYINWKEEDPANPSGSGNCVFTNESLWSDANCASTFPFFCSYQTYKCWDVFANDTTVCSGHGGCLWENHCSCTTCYTGLNCEDGPVCTQGCNAGTCIDCNVCACNASNHIYGISCEETIKNAKMETIDDELILVIEYHTQLSFAENITCNNVTDIGDNHNCKFYGNAGGLTVELRIWKIKQPIYNITIFSLSGSQTVSLIIQHPKTPKNNPIYSTDMGIIAVVVGCSIGIILLCLGPPFFIIITMLSIVKKKMVKNLPQVDEFYIHQLEESEKLIATLDIDKNLFCVSYDSLSVKKSLGKGSGGTVFRAEWEGTTVAFKCFDTSSFLSKDHSFEMFEKEARLLLGLTHPNIVHFYGCTIKPPRVGIIMEFCEHGDLTYYITVNNPPRMERLRLLLDVANAMNYIHGKMIIHRDLKPENVFVTQSIKGPTAKIGDFGIGKEIGDTEQLKTMCIGTSVYMAPEVVVGSDYHTECDVFSFGIMLQASLLGKFNPYGSVSCNIEIRVAADPTFRPDTTDPILQEKEKELMQRCWKHDPKERPAFSHIIAFMKLMI